MATTTPNFGWPVPTSTDLVKDGATAMEALGDAIDTSMVDLKGGTTGQILSKASSADMDFSWTTPNPGDITGVTAGTGISGGGTSGDVTITNSMATAIDAKGDLIAGTGADAFSRLAAGSNGETLVADSSTSTGLRYQEPKATNPVLNSAFQIWQRGTSFSLAASTGFSTGFLADRWQTSTGVNQACTISRQSTNDTTNLPNIQYCLRYQRNSGQTGTGNLLLAQSFETVNAIPYAGKTITFSFYARAGANYSATSNALGVVLSTGTGTDQNITSGYTGAAYPINLSTATLTTTWQRFSYTASIAATATELGVYFQFTPTGTASTNDYFEITGVQLEVGSVATPFKTYAGTIQGELAACQRYYYRQGGDVTYQTVAIGGVCNASTSLSAMLPLPVQFRTTASATIDWSTLRVVGYNSSGSLILAAVTAITIGENGKNIINLAIATGGGLAAGYPYWIDTNGSTSGYLALSAEL